MAIDFENTYATGTFNLTTGAVTIQYLSGKANDTGRGLFIEMRNASNVVVAPSVETMILYGTRPDSTKVYFVAEREGNRMRFDFNNSLYEVSGNVNAEIQLIDVMGVSKKSNTFVINAIESAFDSTYIKSTDDFRVLVDALDRVEALEEDKTTMTEEYNSVIGEVIKSYSYDMMESQITTLANLYGDRLTVQNIGTSVLGRNIKAIILGNPNGSYKTFVMSGQHARESHNTPIILKQIEYYCKNWHNLFKGERVSDIFKNSAIYFVPSANPDGMELCRIGIDSIPTAQTSRINSVKSALEWKIKNNISRNNDVTPDWDLYPQIVWTGNTGKIANYVFRNQDMYMWKSNANGVDLHYNCYETGYNESHVKAYATQSGWRTSFASENYIGASGFSEPESLAIKNFIIANGLTKYAISYHGRGATMFWNYKETGEVARRNLMIAQDLADLSKTPYSQSSNGEVGFAGWYHKRYPNGFSCTYETGWTYFPINEDNNHWNTNNPIDICPLKDEQFPFIWKSQKQTMIMLLKKYAREQDVTTRKVILTTYDFQLSKSNLDNNGVLKSPSGIIKMWGVSIADFTGLNRGYLDVTISLPESFHTKNLGGFANAYGTVNDTEIISFNVDRASLSSITVRVRSNTNLNRQVPFYWCVEGF